MREPLRELAEIAKKIERGYYLCGLTSNPSTNAKTIPRKMLRTIAAIESQCKIVSLQIAKIIAELESMHGRQQQSLSFKEAPKD